MYTFETLLAAVARALEEHHLPYMVIGGQAVLLYGEPRLTRDIDITLGADVDAFDKVQNIADALELEIVPDNAHDFVKRTSLLPVVDVLSGIRVDFIFSFTPYERQAISRARGVEIGGAKVSVATPEDAVIHKLFAGRPRDLEDAESILSKQPHIDIVYVERWLKEFSTLAGRDLVRSVGD